MSVEIDALPAVVDAQDALQPDAPLVHDGLTNNVVVESRFDTPDFAAAMAGAHRRIDIALRSRRQNATPLEARGAHAAFDPAIGPHHADLRHADAASAAHRHRRRARFAGIRSARHRAGRRRRLRTENVAARRIRRAGLAGAKVSRHRRLERGPARKSDRGLSQPRSEHSPRRRVRCAGQADRPVGGCPGQYRRLFVLSHDLRRRTADGRGRDAGPIRRARLCVRCARRRDPYLHHGAYRGVSRPVITAGNRAADGQGSGRVRLEPGRNSQTQFDRALSLHLRDRPRHRRRKLSADAGASRRHRRPARLSRAANRSASPRRLSRHRLRDVFRTHRLWQPGLRGARHGDHPGMGERRDRNGSVRPRRGPHRREPARPGAAHDAWRRSSPTRSA